MEHYNLVSKVLHSQKSVSDHFFSLLSVAQNNTENLLNITLDQCTWLPDAGKKSCYYWNDSFLKTTENMKKLVDMGYVEAEKLLSETREENQPETPVKTAEKKAPDASPKRKGNASTTSSYNENDDKKPVTP